MIYTGSPSFILAKKLQNLKFFLKRWSKEQYGKVASRKKEITEKINELNLKEESNKIIIDDFFSRAQYKVELKKIRYDEARKWQS